MISKTVEKLADPEYRKAFVASQINIGIPFQIRGLLKSRPGWTQATLAERAGMLQPRISGLMTPGKVRPNIETLRRIAEAFDCGLVVRFAPFSELARWSEEFNPETFNVPSFGDDSGFSDQTEPAEEKVSSEVSNGLVQAAYAKAGKIPLSEGTLFLGSSGVALGATLKDLASSYLPHAEPVKKEERTWTLIDGRSNNIKLYTIVPEVNEATLDNMPEKIHVGG